MLNDINVSETILNDINPSDWIGPNDIGVWASCFVLYRGECMQTMIEWKEGGGGGDNSKQRGQKILTTLHLIQKMHVSDTSHQINSNYLKKTLVKLKVNGNLMIASQMTSGWPCNGTCNGGIH